MLSWVASILLTLSLTVPVANACSTNLCIDSENKSFAILHMDIRNWLVLKSGGKSLNERIIGQAKDHGGFMIGHSKPIKIANK